MNLAFAINRKFIPHFMAVLKSIESSNNKDRSIIINVLFLDLLERDLSNIKNEFSCFSFVWHDMKEYNFNNFFVNAHISYETYFRIMIAEIIKEDKVLYLDSDLIVRKSLSALYDKNIESYAVAAIYDYKAQNRKQELDMPEFADYFNAGVLLMNLKYWREYDLTDRLVGYIQSKGSKLIYWDQDALNALLYDKVLIIEDTWNVQTASFEPDNIDKAILEDPAIVHFTGASKPWHISSSSIYQSEYLSYLSQTSVKYLGLVSKNVKKILNSKKDIYIWGAGITGEKVYQYLGVDIKGFIDSDSMKAGQRFNGKPIYSIEELSNSRDIGILICTGYYNEIAEILKALGYKENIDFVHQM
ncbi:glycosyltransferase [Lysinibacillus piscis]|uniref:LPS 1,2-glucosyltransferase n=1 Tax=Lysinibacillus piscis TaxID=2518931 RepID=A0ABQ5NHF7_9BACI|nr:glycosyltransferase [Lysinibacillus sp. KH24]GLC87808.1 LPS 1,2-glucosyltransferase [Lysinibacillus sp. KH24]